MKGLKMFCGDATEAIAETKSVLDGEGLDAVRS
jgi:hypothetical protein